jgi:hypothetical protein
MWGHGGPYYVWVDFLRRWSAGERVDPTALPTVELQDLTEDAWERFTNQLSNAVGTRLATWSRVLTRALGDARDEFGVARALVDARAGVQPIRSMAAHPGLPSGLTKPLLDTVDGQIRTAQQSLEKQVESMRRSGVDRSFVEARLRTIRDNALTAAIADVQPATPRPADGWAVDPTATRRRRVIVDENRVDENRKEKR